MRPVGLPPDTLRPPPNGRTVEPLHDPASKLPGATVQRIERGVLGEGPARFSIGSLRPLVDLFDDGRGQFEHDRRDEQLQTRQRLCVLLATEFVEVDRARHPSR